MSYTTEEVDALWKLCKAIYGEKAKHQRYMDRDFKEMIDKATAIAKDAKNNDT